MNGFTVIPLSDLINTKSESCVSKYLSSFSCTRDRELESFLHNDSVTYEKRDLCRTYLIIDYTNNHHIMGFVSLAFTIFKASKDCGLSITVKKRMNLKNNESAAYLIGQICKNDDVIEKLGDDMMDFALKMISNCFKLFGGRIICIDCKNIDSLVKWYESHGFSIVNLNPATGLFRMARCIT